MKKHSISRDKKRRLLFSQYELKRKMLKSLIYNRNIINPKEKNEIGKLLYNFPKNSSGVRIKNRCILTGRSRAIFSFFKMSRLSFRKMASFGFLPGVTKSSW